MLTSCVLAAILMLAGGEDALLERHTATLRDRGEDPKAFVLELLEHHDLLLFDDALHNAVEPFEFYEQLVQDDEFQKRVDFLFLETIPLNKQRHLDAYLESEVDDRRLLYPAFQDDTSGTGLSLQNYVDLLATVRRTNLARPSEHRLRVIAVSNPTYWSEIETREDVRRFRDGLLGRDYDMYRYILAQMGDFDGSKGVFLTNTRHAYTSIRKANGELYWNTGTYFRLNHPDKTYSLRFHNVTLFIEKKVVVDASTPTTSQGLETKSYRWVRMADGLWDSAFEEHGQPVAFSLRGTAFGEAAYIGNHMLDVAPGQNMANAYDGLIYLAPLETLRQSATWVDIYSAEFMPELARRYALLLTQEQLEAAMEERNLDSVEELVAEVFKGRPERGVPAVGPRDAWRRR